MEGKAFIGNKLATLMTLKGISQTQISEQGQVDRSNLNRFLRGHSDIRSESLVRILKLLGLDLDAFLNDQISLELGQKQHEDEELALNLLRVLTSMEPLVAKTLLDSMLAKVRRHDDPTVKKSIEKLSEYSRRLSVLRRTGGGNGT